MYEIIHRDMPKTIGIRLGDDIREPDFVALRTEMAAILPPEDYDLWLDPSAGDGARLLTAFPAEAMEAFPVSTRVGNVRNDDPALIDPVQIQSTLDLTAG